MDSCAACHRLDGAGQGRTLPPLAGAATVLAENPASLVAAVLEGARLPSTAGQPTRQIITGKPQYDHLVPLSHAELLDATHLRLSYPQGAVTITVTLLKDQRRIRPYEAVASNGMISVSGGNVKATGQPTNWLLKCAD